MKKGLLVACVCIYLLVFIFSIYKTSQKDHGLLVHDVGRLYPAHVQEIVHEQQVEGIQEVLAQARRKNLNVSIAGSQHSQGGHTFYDGAVVLNMKDFDRILALDIKNKVITVQSGATWDEVQEYINPFNLSVKVMQSSNIFTIGGTMSANAHGRDLDKTSMIESVKSFRLLLANGSIINVSRTQNPELFSLVIGGYGMFGIILEADIQLTDNELYETRTRLVHYDQFATFFQQHIQNNQSIALMLARPSIDPETLFEDISIVTWERTSRTAEGVYALKGEEHVARDKFLFGLSRSFDWGKRLRWKLQQKYELEDGRLMSRNNAMRPPTAPIELLDYSSSADSDIVQEFYIPIRTFPQFATAFKEILKEEEVNLLSFTIRYVAANNESLLSYAPREDAFAIIYYSNVGLDKKGMNKARITTQRVVDLTIKNNGTYYLTYNLFPTQEQIRKAYPNIDYVFERKKYYDPQEIFMNKFYAKYALGQEDEKNTIY